MISLTSLRDKPCFIVLNPLQSTCLFHSRLANSCSNQGGRLSSGDKSCRISTCPNAWLDRTKFIRRCILWELCVISLLLKVTPMIRNCIWQRVGTKPNCGVLHTQGGLEQTQCHQQQQTDCNYGHGMQTTKATLETVKVTRRMEWSSVLNAVLSPIWQSERQASHLPSLTGSQEHSAQQVSMLWSFL